MFSKQNYVNNFLVYGALNNRATFSHVAKEHHFPAGANYEVTSGTIS